MRDGAGGSCALIDKVYRDGSCPSRPLAVTHVEPVEREFSEKGDSWR